VLGIVFALGYSVRVRVLDRVNAVFTVINRAMVNVRVSVGFRLSLAFKLGLGLGLELGLSLGLGSLLVLGLGQVRVNFRVVGSVKPRVKVRFKVRVQG
jgi:hypothetical protein